MGTTRGQPLPPGRDIEETRLATQSSRAMPAPNALGGGILDPNLKAGHETFAQIAVGAADAAAPNVPATVADVAAEAPARLLRDSLDGLDPANVAAAHTVGTQGADLVGAMMSRDTLPKPDLADPTADVDVQYADGEAYVSKRGLRITPTPTRPAPSASRSRTSTASTMASPSASSTTTRRSTRSASLPGATSRPGRRLPASASRPTRRGRSP